MASISFRPFSLFAFLRLSLCPWLANQTLQRNLSVSDLTSFHHNAFPSACPSSSGFRVGRTAPNLLLLRQLLLHRRSRKRNIHQRGNHHACSAKPQQPPQWESRSLAWYGNGRWRSCSRSCYLDCRSRVSLGRVVKYAGLELTTLHRSPCNLAANEVKWCVTASTLERTGFRSIVERLPCLPMSREPRRWCCLPGKPRR